MVFWTLIYTLCSSLYIMQEHMPEHMPWGLCQWGTVVSSDILENHLLAQSKNKLVTSEQVKQFSVRKLTISILGANIQMKWLSQRVPHNESLFQWGTVVSLEFLENHLLAQGKNKLVTSEQVKQFSVRKLTISILVANIQMTWLPQRNLHIIGQQTKIPHTGEKASLDRCGWVHRYQKKLC